MSTNHSEKAVNYFMQGYNCAQSTAAAFAEECGFEPEVILRMTAGFGGGIGGLRETCGAVGAMAFVAGLRVGSYAPDDLTAKKRLYDQIKAMVHAFANEHGTICCRELLEKASCEVPPDPSARNAEYYTTRPCAQLVASAADIISQSLATLEQREP